MTCPCGYYSSCTEFCTPERIANIKAQHTQNWREAVKLLNVEFQKDADEAKDERYS